ncbi:MAG: hypothetical protein A3J76_02695 [Candidatus Moranbacteria bacterium RBG_13_45_13]|nr:MAG: hypothetical protein A3J76_02695 [Candidatus Moranbacteria bacterium RBG_13_45_13]
MKKVRENELLLKIFVSAVVLFGILFFSFQAAQAASLVPCGTSENPQACTLCHLVIGFKNIFEYLIKIILFPLFTLGIVIAGVLYMVSSGNKSLIEKAKTAFTYSLAGAVIALTSWLLVNSVLHALGYKSVGSWWNYTCDTAPTSGAGTTGSGGSTVPRNQNTGTGDGNCGGVKVQGSEACQYTSKQLDDVLACINKEVAMGGEDAKGIKIARIGLGANIVFAASMNVGLVESIDNLRRCGGGEKLPGCVHSATSCHYGGVNCLGQINAADLSGGDLSALKDAAISCGADSVIYGQTAYYGGNSKAASDHDTHVHISVNNSTCGCDYMR